MIYKPSSDYNLSKIESPIKDIVSQEKISFIGSDKPRSDKFRNPELEAASA
jgi:hypothetical protein